MESNIEGSTSASDNPSAASTGLSDGPKMSTLSSPSLPSTPARSARPITYAPPRSLRARASLPATLTASASRTAKSALPPKDLDKIKAKLEPEGIVSRREEVVKEKEGQLRELVDGHDTAVREIFHLERYISLLEGWDPKVSRSWIRVLQQAR